jgi:hypothetical protein
MEYLTTGKMIDSLPFGGVAKTLDRIKDEYVTRTEEGFYWCNESGYITYGDSLIINDVVANMKWKII